MKKYILIGLALLLGMVLNAQISLIGGLNYCYVRNNNLIKKQHPIFAPHFGGSIRFYPIKKYQKFSFQNELTFTQKGYIQLLDKEYVFRFNYASLLLLLNYAPVEKFTVSCGTEFNYLLSTSVKQGKKIYNNYDIGINFGLAFFEQQRISFYTRFSYGLLPLLNYYTFDKLGNFTAEIHDLKNTCFMAGIKINIRNEKILFYK